MVNAVVVKKAVRFHGSRVGWLSHLIPRRLLDFVLGHKCSIACAVLPSGFIRFALHVPLQRCCVKSALYC
jgi:hypothetical protein